MNGWIGIMACLVAAFATTPPPGEAQAPAEGPQLVVLISIDQLRGDLLEHYAPMFTGGLRRFLDEGHRYTQASHAHANTETAVGHATLSTGVFPSRSGIVANNWAVLESGSWRDMYAVEDPGSEILGLPRLPGRSPRNLLRDGLADWVLAADPEARVASISSKDRSAITLAGRTRGEVYWLASGRFVTSRYYRRGYPGWVQRFNQEVMPTLLTDTVWESSVPEEHRGLARPDEASYEGDGVNTTFPHLASREATPEGRIGWLLRGPAADRAVAAFAREAVQALELGRRGHVDFLALGFSAADYVGHGYGPFSQEQLDNLHRLDGELDALLAFLDEYVGPGRWVAALSSDHGAATMPEYLTATGRGAHRIDSGVRSAALETAVRDAGAGGGRPEEVARRLARLVEERGLVARAYTVADFTLGSPPDSFAILVRNSYHPGRAAGRLSPYGVEIRFGYQELVSGAHGTSHGTPYWYDRHVPIVLLGAGVRPGSTDAPAYTIDVAPTLAKLAGIPVPEDLDGRALSR